MVGRGSNRSVYLLGTGLVWGWRKCLELDRYGGMHQITKKMQLLCYKKKKKKQLGAVWLSFLILQWTWRRKPWGIGSLSGSSRSYSCPGHTALRWQSQVSRGLPVSFLSLLATRQFSRNPSPRVPCVYSKANPEAPSRQTPLLKARLWLFRARFSPSTERLWPG